MSIVAPASNLYPSTTRGAAAHTMQGVLTLALPPTLKLSVTEGPSSSQSFSSTGCFLTVGRTKRSSIFIKDNEVSEVRHRPL